MRFRHEVYVYVTGRYGARRAVFGPYWKDTPHPAAVRNRYRFAPDDVDDQRCAVRHLEELGCTSVHARTAVGPVNPAVRSRSEC